MKIDKHTHKPRSTLRVVTARSGDGPTAQKAVAAHQTADHGTPRACHRLARGPGATPQVSTSLEGWMPPRANLHLARGLDAPSGESPPRSRDSDPRASLCLARGRPRPAMPHLLPRPEYCSGTSRAPGSKANPRHASPLTPSGNHIPALFHQPALCGHPQSCAEAVREG
jgi:hypothetical protein